MEDILVEVEQELHLDHVVHQRVAVMLLVVAEVFQFRYVVVDQEM